MNFLGLLALALAPALAIITFIYARDEYEKEPMRLIRKSFFYGLLSVLIASIISAVLTVFLNDRMSLDVLTERQDWGGMFFLAFFGVGLVEEFSKWIILKRVIFNWKNFNEPFDGIVYSVMVSLGFATLENVMYIFGISAMSSLEDGYLTGFLRMFTAVPAHATNAVIMGYFIGKAKFQKERQFECMTIALVGATVFHGAYDFFAFISWVDGLFAGSVVSLLTAAYLSVKAMHVHKMESPFRPGALASSDGPSKPTTYESPLQESESTLQ
jgi:RsiW-degrading membrane proteinase PrsW (M82 family)